LAARDRAADAHEVGTLYDDLTAMCTALGERPVTVPANAGKDSGGR